jgi:hypothetical protein
MLKLPLLLLFLLGAGLAQEQHPDQHSLSDLQSNARVLIVFAPTARSADFQRQLQLIERHSFELSERNTVVVPVSAAVNAQDRFAFENLPLGTAAEQAYARSRFHVRPSEFLVVLIDQNGSVQMRWPNPVDIHALTASLDALPRH